MQPLILDIKYNSYEDGPGIRTVVFFKGCPLHCAWCHNPEAISKEPQIAFYKERCIRCYVCKSVCKMGAIKEGEERVLQEACTLCGACTKSCPTSALKILGRRYKISELLTLLLKDALFYKASFGGVTLSGGEPTMFPLYVGALLRKLKERRIHTAIQTCGLFVRKDFSKYILPFVDLVFFDIKVMDPNLHKKYTGVENNLILENLCWLHEEGANILPTIPLIPSFTDSRENLESVASFLKDLKIKGCLLLPYNPLGLQKYERIGKEAPSLPDSFMEDLKIYKEIFLAEGVSVRE